MTDNLAIPDGVKTAANALALPDGLNFEQWLTVGRQVVGAAEASWWWVGDWLTYAEDTFAPDGDSAAQAKVRQAVAEITTLDPTVLTEAQRVARRFPAGARRRRLSWAHHRSLVDAQPTLVDELLAGAEREGWTESQLASERRKWEATDVKEVEAPSTAKATLTLVVPDDWADEAHAAVEKAAEELRQSLQLAGVEGTVKVR